MSAKLHNSDALAMFWEQTITDIHLWSGARLMIQLHLLWRNLTLLKSCQKEKQTNKNKQKKESICIVFAVLLAVIILRTLLELVLSLSPCKLFYLSGSRNEHMDVCMYAEYMDNCRFLLMQILKVKSYSLESWLWWMFPGTCQLFVTHSIDWEMPCRTKRPNDRASDPQSTFPDSTTGFADIQLAS